MANILADHISKLKCMGMYDDILNPEERRKEFGHFMFDELPPITTDQEGSTVFGNQLQHVQIAVRL